MIIRIVKKSIFNFSQICEFQFCGSLKTLSHRIGLVWQNFAAIVVCTAWVTHMCLVQKCCLRGCIEKKHKMNYSVVLSNNNLLVIDSLRYGHFQFLYCLFFSVRGKRANEYLLYPLTPQTTLYRRRYSYKFSTYYPILIICCLYMFCLCSIKMVFETKHTIIFALYSLIILKSNIVC